jgi:hypothetical protein
MPHNSHLEIERKYDVDPQAAVPDLVGSGPIAVADEPETFHLDARYYDTASMRLAGQGIALRRRSGGSDEGWHVKVRGDEGRTETQWPLSDGGVPAEVLDFLADPLGDEELVQIASIRTVRVAQRLLDAAGYPIAELADDHVEAEDLRTATRRAWREWEVELLAAAPDTRKARTALLDEIERRILEAGATTASIGSKLARTLGA